MANSKVITTNQSIYLVLEVGDSERHCDFTIHGLLDNYRDAKLFAQQLSRKIIGDFKSIYGSNPFWNITCGNKIMDIYCDADRKPHRKETCIIITKQFKKGLEDLDTLDDIQRRVQERNAIIKDELIKVCSSFMVF